MAMNFPDTQGKPTDGSFTYTVDGVTYAWYGYWTVQSGAQVNLQTVTDAGSTTTNGASFGDVQLNADGSASFGSGFAVITNNGILQNLQTQSTANSSAYTFIGRDAQNGDANTFTVTGGGDLSLNGTFAIGGGYTQSYGSSFYSGTMILRYDGSSQNVISIFKDGTDSANRKFAVTNEGTVFGDAARFSKFSLSFLPGLP